MQHPTRHSWSPKLLAGLIAGFGSSPALVQASDNQVFTLGEVQVVATARGESGIGTSSIDLEEIREQNRETVAAALDMQAGVNLSKTGARNEQTLYVRGFDLRQVPVFVDGIPIYVPYDGYVDLARFNTFDLSRIEISRGFSPMVYGANTLGGAINLVSRRPSAKFEGEIGGGVTFDSTGSYNGYRSYTNLGTNQGMWYAQFGLSYLDQDYYRIPDNFSARASENGGQRENSYNTDRKFNLKLGLTPNSSDEYTINFISQHGTKGNPPYAGNDPSSTLRYWQWPYWDKDSIYLLTSTAFGDHRLKLRLYHDTFKNSLFSFDDATYSSKTKKYAFESWYDDYSNGFSSELDLHLSSNNDLKLAYHIKEDVHREHNWGEPSRRFRDLTQSINLEDAQRLSSQLSLVTGLGYDWRKTLDAQDYNSTTKLVSDFQRGSNDALNAQAGLLYRTSASGRVQASIAHKSRFASIKERYSYRFGTAIPNADLKTEEAVHYEAGYSDRISSKLSGEIRLFYSDISNLIQSTRIANTACSTPPCAQNQNVAKASSTGMEAEIRGELFNSVDLVAAYAYLDRRNRSDDGLFLTDSPRHKFFTALTWHAGNALALTASANGMSSRYTSSNGVQIAPGFAIANLKASYRFGNGLNVEAGVYNVFDKLYSISEGYPEAGRTFFTNFNLPL